MKRTNDGAGKESQMMPRPPTNDVIRSSLKFKQDGYVQPRACVRCVRRRFSTKLRSGRHGRRLGPKTGDRQDGWISRTSIDRSSLWRLLAYPIFDCHSPPFPLLPQHNTTLQHKQCLRIHCTPRKLRFARLRR